MKVLRVKTREPYDIIISQGLIETVPEDLKRSFSFGKVAIITDEKVASIYGERILENFVKLGIRAKLFSFPPGEGSKNIETVIYLARKLVQRSYDRKDLIVALGGGVVGDIAGFLASIYLRGIPYVQVPTTLLAQVDSSVGGKTGVDLPEGKNLIGTFYQPKKVYIDVDTLKTLPVDEIKNGLAEVIKYGCTLKKGLFEFIRKKKREILSLNPEAIEHIIYESCRLKAMVVSKDEKESGLRRVLNFGHTIGHAIEVELNYQIPHGIAVALGMLVEARLSEKLGVAKEKVFASLKELLGEFSFPEKIAGITPDNLILHIQKDKKVAKGTLTIVLLERIGKYIFYTDPSKDAILEVLSELF